MEFAHNYTIKSLLNFIIRDNPEELEKLILIKETVPLKCVSNFISKWCN